MDNYTGIIDIPAGFTVKPSLKGRNAVTFENSCKIKIEIEKEEPYFWVIAITPFKLDCILGIYEINNRFRIDLVELPQFLSLTSKLGKVLYG